MIAVPLNNTQKVLPPENTLLCENKEEFYSHDVVLLTASINYTQIYLCCGRVITSTKTLKKFEGPLTKLGFLRINKSAIINPAFMDNHSPTEVIMQNGQIMKVARRRKQMMRETFFAH